MASTLDFLAILNTRRYTEDEVKELRTQLEKMDTDVLTMLYCAAAHKDEEMNGLARREGRHMDIQRRWENLLPVIKRAYDTAKLRENKGPWILSNEHILDIIYYRSRRFHDIFHPPA